MRPYPLQALQQVRSTAVEACQQNLAEALRTAEAARQGVVRATQELEQEREQQRRLRDAERARTAAGLARVADLQRAAGHQPVIAQREATLVEGLRRAEQALVAAENRQGKAQRALGEARAEAKMLDRHRDGFEAEQRARVSEQQDEAALEAWNAGN